MATRDELSEFFRFLWKDTKGAICISSHAQDLDIWSNRMFNWPSQEPNIIEYVQLKVAEGYEVYHTPALYKNTTSRQKDNLLGSHVLWADFDGNAPDDWSEPSAAVSAPSLRVQSSSPSNQHCYWALEEFLTDIPMLESKNRSLAYQFHADVSGWDGTQLLRPPGTINRGYSKPDRGQEYPVLLEEISDRQYQLNFIEAVDDFRPIVAAALESAEIPSVAKALADGSWPVGFLSIFEQDSPPKGERSDAIMRVGYFAAEAGLDDAGVYAIVRNVDDRWGIYTGRSTARRQKILVDIVERALAKRKSTNFSALFTGNAPSNEQIIYGYKDFVTFKAEIEWFFQGLLSTHGYGILAGDPGVGKTQIGLRFARSIACGRDFLIWKNELKAKQVLFLSLEMHHAGLNYFLHQMDTTVSSEDLALLEKNLKIGPLARTLPLDRQEGRDLLQSFLETYKPDVVFLDSLSKSTYKSLSDEEGIKQFNDYIQQVRSVYGTTIIVIHHSKKPQGRERRDGLNGLYGSRFISAEVDFLLSFYKTEVKGILDVEIPKIRYSEEPDSFQLTRTPDLNFEVTFGESGGGTLLDRYKQNHLAGTTSSGNDNSGPGRFFGKANRH